MTRDEWISAFAEQVGVTAPGPETIEKVLALAAEAAHASERTAAPIACYIAAVSGVPLDEVLHFAAAIGPEPEQ
jgi:hypothetical protein